MVKCFSISCGNCVPGIPHPISDSPFDSIVYPTAVTRNNLLLLRTPFAGVSRIYSRFCSSGVLNPTLFQLPLNLSIKSKKPKFCVLCIPFGDSTCFVRSVRFTARLGFQLIERENGENKNYIFFLFSISEKRFKRIRIRRNGQI